jgi:hypothetical protein
MLTILEHCFAADVYCKINLFITFVAKFAVLARK